MTAVPERHVPHQEQARHDHAGHPQVEDLVAGHERGVGVEQLQLGRLLRPAQRGEGPELRGEPGVQHILVLHDLPAALRARGRILHGHRHVAVRAVPRGDAMSPPQLPRDVPVAQVVQPGHEGALPALRGERHAPVQRGLFGGAGEPADLHEPLQARDPRLDLRVAPVAVAHRVQVRPLLLHDEAQLLERARGPPRAPRSGRARGTPAERRRSGWRPR
jgi:hypothetical protein